MHEKDPHKARQEERRDVKRRGPIITSLAIKHFKDTALVDEKKPIEDNTIATIRNFYLEAAPFAHPKVFPDLWDHLLLASLYGKHLARITNDPNLTPHEAEAIGLLQDIGSLIVPHRYYRKEVVNQLLEKNIGLRPSLREKFSPVAQILGRLRFVHTPDDIKLPQVVNDVTDNLSKIGADGRILTIKQTMQRNRKQPQRYDHAIFPTERWGLKALTEGKRQSAAIRLLRDEMRLLTAKYNIDFRKLRQDVWREYQLPENQAWLTTVKNAQESLDATIDEELGRPSIQTVVFDVGGVLFEDADPSLAEAISRVLGKTREEVWQPVQTLLDEGMSGALNEETYLREYFSQLGIPIPSLKEAKTLFRHPAIYHPIPEMQEVVRKLSENPNIQLYILSDSISPLAEIVAKQVRNYFPQIPESHIYISSVIEASKKSVTGEAFKKLLVLLGNPEPETVLFIDDKEAYTKKARANYGIRAVTFRGDPFKEQTAPERIKSELIAARLAA